MYYLIKILTFLKILNNLNIQISLALRNSANNILFQYSLLTKETTKSG